MFLINKVCPHPKLQALIQVWFSESFANFNFAKRIYNCNQMKYGQLVLNYPGSRVTSSSKSKVLEERPDELSIQPSDSQYFPLPLDHLAGNVALHERMEPPPPPAPSLARCSSPA